MTDDSAARPDLVYPYVRLPVEPDVVAPDGSHVRVLAGLPAGSMAHFELATGEVSVAVVHRTVSELWFVLGGAGVMWLSGPAGEAELELGRGVSFGIPVGTAFQFRSDGPGPLTIVGTTMPPWPGDGEAVPTQGRWVPTVIPG